jgi:predicted nucleotidyltransferase
MTQRLSASATEFIPHFLKPSPSPSPALVPPMHPQSTVTFDKTDSSYGDGNRTYGKPKKTKEQRGPRKRRRAKRSVDIGNMEGLSSQFDSVNDSVKYLDLDDDDDDSEIGSEKSSNLSSFSEFSALTHLMKKQGNGAAGGTVHQPTTVAPMLVREAEGPNSIIGEGSGIADLFSWLKGQRVSGSPTPANAGIAANGLYENPPVPLSPETTHGQWLQMQYEWLLSKNHFVEEDEFIMEQAERRKWSMWAVHASETERQRRMQVLKDIDIEQDRERAARRKWANEQIEGERNDRISNQFLASLASTQWFNETISAYSDDYELVCPYYKLGCRVNCRRSTLRQHLLECEFCMDLSTYLNKDRTEGDVDGTSATGLGHAASSSILEYEVVCPNAILGCRYSGERKDLTKHLQHCEFRGKTIEQEQEERHKLKQLVINECEEERSRRVLDSNSHELAEHLNISEEMLGAIRAKFPNDSLATIRNTLRKAVIGGYPVEGISNPSKSYDSLSDDNMVSSSEDDLGIERRFVTGHSSRKNAKKSKVHGILQSQHEAILDKLHDEIGLVWNRFHEFQEANTKPIVNKLISDLQNVIKDLWPFSQLELFGSFSTGIIGRSSDIDIVVYFSDEFKELLTLRGAIPLLHALASHLEAHGRELIHIKNVLLHARIPIIKAESVLPVDAISLFGEPMPPMKLSIDISIDGPNHSGLATTQLVLTLMKVLPPLGPVALILKEYLKGKNLSDSFTGGLPSYGMIMLLLLPILQHIRMKQTNVHPLSLLVGGSSVIRGGNKQRVPNIPLPGSMSPVRLHRDRDQLPTFQTPRSRSQSELSALCAVTGRSDPSDRTAEPEGYSNTLSAPDNAGNVVAQVRRRSLPSGPTTPQQHDHRQSAPLSGSHSSRRHGGMSPIVQMMTAGSTSSGSVSNVCQSNVNYSRFPEFPGGNNIAQRGPVRRRSGTSGSTAADHHMDRSGIHTVQNLNSSLPSVGVKAAGRGGFKNCTWSAIDQQKEYGRRVAMKILSNDMPETARHNFVSPPVEDISVSSAAHTARSTSRSKDSQGQISSPETSSPDVGGVLVSLPDSSSEAPENISVDTPSEVSCTSKVGHPPTSLTDPALLSSHQGLPLSPPLDTPRQFLDSTRPIYGILIEAVSSACIDFMITVYSSRVCSFWSFTAKVSLEANTGSLCETADFALICVLQAACRLILRLRIHCSLRILSTF